MLLLLLLNTSNFFLFYRQKLYLQTSNFLLRFCFERCKYTPMYEKGINSYIKWTKLFISLLMKIWDSVYIWRTKKIRPGPLASATNICLFVTFTGPTERFHWQPISSYHSPPSFSFSGLSCWWMLRPFWRGSGPGGCHTPTHSQGHWYDAKGSYTARAGHLESPWKLLA